MAASMMPETEASITPTDSSVENEDLVHCGICRKLLQDPRTLSCLHSFCLKCLQQHIESAGKGVTFLCCPTCSTGTKLPSGGVSDLDVIAFVSRQRNERLMREKLADEDAGIQCTACDGTAAESSSDSTENLRALQAVTRCFVCDDYLCERCTNMHKIMRSLKRHPLFTLDELRSEKVPLSLPDQNTCQKHKGEVLMFYCETCDVPICSKCAVIAHRHPDHKQAELDNAAAERSKKILELETESAQVATKVDELIALNEDLEQQLKAASAEALDVIDETKESIKEQFLENLEKTYTESTDKLQQYEEQKRAILRKNLTKLKNDRSRLSTSRMIARDVTQKGTEYEIAAVYASVTSSLKELSEQKLETPAPKLGMVRFRTIEPDLPVVNVLLELDPPLLKMNKVKEFGNLVNGRGIVCTEAGSIMVANFDSAAEYYYHVYSDKGQLSSKIDTGCGTTGGGKYSSPWCVVLHPNGRIFGTGDTQHVKQYQGDGKYVNRYSTRSPDNVASDADNSTVQGLALDKDGNLIVGNVTKKYVSIMKPDGTHITSMYVPIQPWFIFATPTDNIIISSYEERAVHVIDRTGKVLITFNPPDGVDGAAWNPTGICCSKDGNVFIANYQGRVGVYQYDLEYGMYIGCNINDVAQPWGLALSKDEKKLAVADNTCVKIFEIKIE
ncbi:E3 ubiquitin-protein ligase TRIM71-like [Amphiura filiformis]|uniref:E3 ubiquitin-protein ligase TRIM71-like n=1 Tax=Amphiura filiformis TaxID=82378 RepID=UPI003B21DD2F